MQVSPILHFWKWPISAEVRPKVTLWLNSLNHLGANGERRASTTSVPTHPFLVLQLPFVRRCLIHCSSLIEPLRSNFGLECWWCWTGTSFHLCLLELSSSSWLHGWWECFASLNAALSLLSDLHCLMITSPVCFLLEGISPNIHLLCKLAVSQLAAIFAVFCGNLVLIVCLICSSLWFSCYVLTGK